MRIGRTAGLLGLAALALVVAQIVVAAPPSADFSISDTTPEVGDTVTFDASEPLSSDPDGDIALYEWDFDYDGSFTPDASGVSPMASTSYGSAGPRSVALQVTDTDAVDGVVQTTTRVRTLNVVATPPPNQAPTAVIACTDVVNPGATVTCDSTGSNDPDGSITEYEWSVDTGGFTDDDAQFTTSFTAAGNHTIRLRVRDNNGALSPVVSDTVSVNGPPTADIALTAGALPVLPPDATVNVALNQSAPLVGQTVEFSSAGSTDPGGSIASRAWDIDGNGFNDGTGITLAHVFTAPGNQTVQLQVVDNGGASAVDSVSFRVNRLPTADFITNDPTPVIDQSIAFLSRSSDLDNDINAYEWDFDNDGQFGEPTEAAGITCQSTTSPNASCRFDNAGTYPVRLRITDAGGISRVATQQIMVQSTVPSGNFTFAPGFPVPGQGVTFTSTSRPSAGKQLTSYEWDFDYDGATFTPDATGPSVTRGFSSAGPKTVALRVREAMPGGGPATGGHDIASRTITVNAPPTAGLRISPQSTFVDEAITISSTSVDPDGPIARLEWDLDRDGRFDDAAGAVVSTSYAAAGRHAVSLRVTDSKGAVATATGVATVRTRPLVMLSGVLIRLNGAVAGEITHIARLTVKAPRGAKVKVKCKGKGCPKQTVKRGRGRTIRFKALERGLPAGIKLTILVSKPGFLGRQTTFTMREARRPKRVDLCLAPGAKRARACPS
jgi:PKD repeat protein